MSDRKHDFLIDTSFHIAHFFSDQDQHSIAHGAIEYIRKKYRCCGFITTHLIFLETFSTVLHGANFKRAVPDKKQRKKFADALCQDIIKHCEIRAVPESMFLDIWNLYTDPVNIKKGFEYVDCSSFVYARDIRKKQYDKHKIDFDGVLSFNPRHFNDKVGKEFNFKVFDYSVLA